LAEKSRSNSFLKPTSTKQSGKGYLLNETSMLSLW